jgi:hypothetical protein
MYNKINRISKDITSIILKMKEEMEELELKSNQIWDIVHNPHIQNIHTSQELGYDPYCICHTIVPSDNIQDGLMKGVMNIPFSNRFLSMKWAKYNIDYGSSNVKSVYIDIVPTQYKTEDLLYFIQSFYHMPFLASLYLSGWDRVCIRDETFVTVRNELIKFLSSKTNFSVRFYMDKELFVQHHFDMLERNGISISLCDNDWD